MKSVAIKATGLKKSFAGKPAVDGVDLHIKAGSIYGFLGPNGAGKSTTVNMLITYLEPSEGDSQILGSSVTHDADDVRLKIGAALQEASLDEVQTGRELLWTQGRLYGLSGKQIEQRVRELERLVDIGEALDQRIKTYSGGMKRRVDLAAALIHKPQVLFLDEPTTGLDPISRNSIWQEIERLNKKEGMTIFLTTQYLEEADALADTIGIISEGRIVAEDTPTNLKKKIGNDVVALKVKSKMALVGKLNGLKGVAKVEQDGKEFLVYTENGGQAVSGIVKLVEKQGGVIEDIEIRKPSLDDVFLSVTGNHGATVE